MVVGKNYKYFLKPKHVFSQDSTRLSSFIIITTTTIITIAQKLRYVQYAFYYSYLHYYQYFFIKKQQKNGWSQ